MINVIIYDISLHLSNPVNKNRDSSLPSIFISNIVVTLTFKTVRKTYSKDSLMSQNKTEHTNIINIAVMNRLLEGGALTRKVATIYKNQAVLFVFKGRVQM